MGRLLHEFPVISNISVIWWTKKPGLDPIFKNFRPVSNLPFVVKLAEKVVISQLYLGIVQKQ